MCGIAGHISFRKPPSPDYVAEFIRRLHHRGPDDQGLWTSPQSECVLGHARLSIIDLSSLGHQPMIDPKTGNSIVFNGEIYNFRSLRRYCESKGDRFRSNSDTEVILALYRHHGIACLDKLRGMFAFALWDEGSKQLFFARDRVGKKPFNYAFLPDGLLFCSEIDPLSRHPQVSREMDTEALELYLQLQYIPAPWTIYRAIRKLPPAHYGIYDRNGLRLEKYWDIDYRKKSRISEADALDGLEEKLTEAVRLRMISDVPLGALLSGGVDSSVVVALMAKLSGEPIHTYSIGFREEAFNELPFAQQAADICGTHHYPETIDGEVGSLLPFIARHHGEPFADNSAIPSFLVCQASRRHVTVALNGDGGDELLGGYPRHLLSPTQICIGQARPSIFSAKALAQLGTALADARNLPARVARKLVLEYGCIELRSLNIRNGYWNDWQRTELLNQVKSSDTLADWRGKCLAAAWGRAAHPFDRMLWLDNHTYLAGCLLPKMDIASMHCGLETRSPLLDHEVIEFCASLPTHYKLRPGIGKYLLKRLAKRYFPAEFVDRPKMGFGTPLADWLRGPLRSILEDTLREPEAMFPLDMAVIGKTLDEFLCGEINHVNRLWCLLMFGQWRMACLTR